MEGWGRGGVGAGRRRVQSSWFLVGAATVGALFVGTAAVETVARIPATSWPGRPGCGRRLPGSGLHPASRTLEPMEYSFDLNVRYCV